jgi:hypothetical protein
MSQLINYWKSVGSDSEPEKLIEARMAEVLKEISDMSQLINYWKSVGSEPKKLIEARMAEVLKGISKENIPETFLGVLKKEIIPSELLPLFKKKARELLE